MDRLDSIFFSIEIFTFGIKVLYTVRLLPWRILKYTSLLTDLSVYGYQANGYRLR